MLLYTPMRNRLSAVTTVNDFLIGLWTTLLVLGKSEQNVKLTDRKEDDPMLMTSDRHVTSL